MSTHEDFRRDEPHALPSNRSFGTLFTIVFLVVGLAPVVLGGSVRVSALVLSAIFLGVTLIRPALLTPLNAAWMKLAAILHRIVSPVVLGICFFGVVTPIGLLMRWSGKDPMRRRFEPGASSYWIPREPPGPSPESIRNQF